MLLGGLFCVYDFFTDTTKGEDMQAASPEISVFWQPGCSSCVRVKEFLTRLEIPFKSVNVLSDTQGRDELRRLGARSIPIVSKGDEFVYAQSIEDVARFVDGMDAITDRLPPEILYAKWTKVLRLRVSRMASSLLEPPASTTASSFACKPCPLARSSRFLCPSVTLLLGVGAGAIACRSLRSVPGPNRPVLPQSSRSFCLVHHHLQAVSLACGRRPSTTGDREGPRVRCRSKEDCSSRCA